jgi:hypothetical protein
VAAAVLSGGSQDGLSAAVALPAPPVLSWSLGTRLVSRSPDGPGILAEVEEVYRLAPSAEPYLYRFSGTSPAFLLAAVPVAPGAGPLQDEASGALQDEAAGQVGAEG